MTTTRARIRQLLNSRGHTAFLAAALVVGFLVGLAVVLLVILVEGASRAAEWVQDQVRNPELAFFITVPIGLFVAWAIAQRTRISSKGLVHC